MAGHSKWNNIKNRKGKEDAKKAKIFSKHSRAITVAVREGGDDIEFNPSLKLAIDKAKADNMPNDNIDRAIKAGSGANSASNYEEVIYEGYGPAGVAVLVAALTDNRNRTAPDVRHAFDKYGGNLGTTGSVSFIFDRLGTIIIEKSDSIDPEELMLEAIDLGAQDFEDHEDAYEITTSVQDFAKVRDGLAENYSLSMAELGYIAQNTVEITDQTQEKNMESLIDMLEENDDVQDVYHNWEV